MALDSRIMAMVAKAACSGDELNEALAARRDRRNRAIRGYRSDGLDDIETGDVARDEMDFIQRVEAYDSEGEARFAEIVATYLNGAPAGDQKRLADKLLRLYEAVTHSEQRREVLERLDSLT